MTFRVDKILARIGSFLSLVVLMGALCSAVSSQTGASSSDPLAELEAWNKIKESTVAADYHAFLQQFPNGSLAIQAREKMNSLGDPVWNELKKSNDPFKYRDYIKANPNSPFLDQAKARLDLLTPAAVEWEKLKANGNLDSVRQLISKAPAHPFAEEAKAEFESRLWEEALRTGEEALFKFYADHYSTPRRSVALEKLKEADDRRKREAYADPRDGVMAQSGNIIPSTHPWSFTYAFASECQVIVTEMMASKDGVTTDTTSVAIKVLGPIETTPSGDGRLWAVIAKSSEPLSLKSTAFYSKSGKSLSSQQVRPWQRLGFFVDHKRAESFANSWRKLIKYCSSAT